jgi:hypothetical protein
VEHFHRGYGTLHSRQKARHNPIGLCADLGEHIIAEEIDEARREMWSNFPRDDI